MSNARIAEVFAGAVELAPDERRAYLDAAAAGAPELRAEVESLLTAHDAASGFLEAPLDAARAAALLAGEPAATTAAERETARIGPYRVVREIGRGGMGMVYLAERADGAFEQRVALKVLERGHDSHDNLRRFLRERQILARLHHPLIAQLHDGGITSDGRPYFAMELVDGMPITRWCAERGATVEERLRLVRDVCRAVQHAHASLVIHRDIKPSNLLVSSAGEIKLLDFGIAALLAEAGPDALPITATSESVMTPQYASPEQFRGDPITTASDVYQLGLIAYELLAGRRPYSLKGVSLDAARRLVCDTMPEPPSRAGDDAPSSQTDPRPREALPRLSGELDTIVLKALQKEPSARYASADQLADDIERFLAGLPIAAHAPTVAYRFRKFLGRHALASAGVAVAVAVMATMAVLFTAGLIHERDQTRAAAEREERRRIESEEVTRFLVELFEVADPAREGPTITARELLDRGAVRVEQELAEQPQVSARLLRAIGDTYRRLGLYRDAEAQVRRAVAIGESPAGGDPVSLAESLESLGLVLRDLGRLDEADAALQRASALFEEHLGPDHKAVGRLHYHLGNLRRHQGRPAEAEPLLRRAVEMLRGVGEPADLAEILDGHGLALAELGRYDEAAAAYDEAIARLESSLGADHPRLATPVHSLAVLHSGLGRHAVSKPLFERAHRLLQTAYGPDHPRTLSALNNLAIDLLELGELDQAEVAFARVEQGFLGSAGANLANVVVNRGNVALERGEAARAESHYRRALGLLEQTLPPGHPEIGTALHNLGEAIAAQGRRDAEAETAFERSLVIFETALGKEHLLVSWPTFHLARLHRRRGDRARAEPLLRRALEIRRRDLEPSSADRREVEAEWAELERELGRPGGGE